MPYPNFRFCCDATFTYSDNLAKNFSFLVESMLTQTKLNTSDRESVISTPALAILAASSIFSISIKAISNFRALVLAKTFALINQVL
jgi:hypothetical protein